MPDGWNTVFGLDRFRVVEPFFDTKQAYTSPDLAAPKSEDSVSSLVHRALQNVDVDARPTLLANVILTGAGSLIEKFADRLQADLQALNPNPRVRVIATSTPWSGSSAAGSEAPCWPVWAPFIRCGCRGTSTRSLARVSSRGGASEADVSRACASLDHQC
ncbi:Actin-related protein 4 [Teratosphaeria destructans]|uniref:Actin-related protein 4 n=1 Tax=Teratosphaeria destructans TaxID=418781 RepID=A0A9W7W6H7_9PEZI|nr:Actin-related protein 4 [Teratosphaeria destructans]